MSSAKNWPFVVLIALETNELFTLFGKGIDISISKFWNTWL